MAVRLGCAHLCFDFPDPLVKPALDFLDSVALAEMPGLIKMMKVRLQFD
jgi:hypothetical protein